MKKLKVFIACDTDKISQIKKIIASTKTNKLNVAYKIGLEFFLSTNGRRFISKLVILFIFYYYPTPLNSIPSSFVKIIYYSFSDNFKYCNNCSPVKSTCYYITQKKSI